jgi:hypothetical protein
MLSDLQDAFLRDFDLATIAHLTEFDLNDISLANFFLVTQQNPRKPYKLHSPGAQRTLDKESGR